MRSSSGKIRVLVVDDSAVARTMISEFLSADAELEVVGTAVDAFQAREKILELQPDVLTLDLDLPRMDGVTFLRILMEHHPMPILVFSGSAKEGSEKAIEALCYGAMDVLHKPDSGLTKGRTGELLIEKIKAMAGFKPLPRTMGGRDSSSIRKKKRDFSQDSQERDLILMGASTGGIEAWTKILPALPVQMPGICLVQHLPSEFIPSFIRRMAAMTTMKVCEARDGDSVQRGHVYVAPGGVHLHVLWQAGQYRIHLRHGEPVWHQCPSVDVLFKSVVPKAGPRVLGVLLTGMGRDGAEGLLKLREKGARTLVQDEKSSVVYGMPRAACELGAAERIVSLGQMPEAMIEIFGTNSSSNG